MTDPPPADGVTGTHYGGPKKPPKALFRYLVNPLMRTILRSPFHGMVSQVIMLVTFTGRKSGRQFTTPVAYRREGDTVYANTHSPFWKNLADGARVTLRLQGRDVPAWAEATQDPEAVLAQVRQVLDQDGVKAVQRMGVGIPGDRQPSEAELRRGIGGLALLTFRLNRTEP